MNTSSKPQLIGISGSFASGKDTIAHHLKADFGFTHVSTSGIVRDIALREQGSIEREVLHRVADEHRRRDGAGVFVQMAIKGRTLPLVVTGIRSMGEVSAIKQAGGVMVFVDAPAKLRYERMKTRHRDDEVKLSLDKFVANEQKEWHSGNDDADFNLRDIKATADVVVSNESDLGSFIQEAYQRLGFRDRYIQNHDIML